ncbi:paeninodin family lasso peptide [Metabacillus arenae]|uniref:Paeninodin family lasso peptide n=1 Tax=Metabacillus arenae TaxID=2771434 RepID=A0A926NGH0_9BACI|nr:paeninodin family lasso peptide [Metabacillus arenae]MBD1380846.1 paeninodin family lasso peptide [Metabacillus arenae]
MKKEWKQPLLEILDISMTMKGWWHDKPPKDPENPGEPGGEFES